MYYKAINMPHTCYNQSCPQHWEVVNEDSEAEKKEVKVTLIDMELKVIEINAALDEIKKLNERIKILLKL